MLLGHRKDAAGTRLSYRLDMTSAPDPLDEPAEEVVAETLRLARDLCMGTAAFVVSTGGTVRVDLPPSAAPEARGRIEALARSSLSRPGAQGRDLFWNAEILGENAAADEAFACVVAQVVANERVTGLLGVVDTWLPELDEEQRAGLLQLASTLGALVASSGRSLDELLSALPAPPELVDTGPPTMRPPGSAKPSPAAPAERAEEAVPSVPSAADFLTEVTEHLPEALLVARDDGTILFANAALSQLSGRRTEEVLGADVSTLLHQPGAGVGTPEDEAVRASLLGTPVPGRRAELSVSSGGAIPVDAAGSRFTSRVAGDCYVTLLRPPAASGTAGGTSEAALGGPSLATLLEALDEGIEVCDHQGVVLLANRASRILQGLDEDVELVGHPFPLSPALHGSDGSPLAQAHHPLVRALNGTVVRSEQLQLVNAQGERRHIVASAKPFPLEKEMGAILVIRDVTSQLEEEAWLMHLALHDPLTGLANRYLLLDYLRRVLVQFRSRGGSVALVFLDLDDFKMINDRYGHDVGDEVLIAVGRRIQGAVRSSDVVARLGGDEFVIAHATSEDPSEIELVMSRIRKTLTAPYQVRGQTLAISASIGWVMADPRHEDPTSLLVRADREMYRRKAARSRGESTP